MNDVAATFHWPCSNLWFFLQLFLSTVIQKLPIPICFLLLKLLWNCVHPKQFLGASNSDVLFIYPGIGNLCHLKNFFWFLITWRVQITFLHHYISSFDWLLFSFLYLIFCLFYIYDFIGFIFVDFSQIVTFVIFEKIQSENAIKCTSHHYRCFLLFAF